MVGLHLAALTCKATGQFLVVATLTVWQSVAVTIQPPSKGKAQQMARGKHGVQAVARREQGSYESDLATYQRQIAQQRTEVLALRSLLSETKTSHAAEMRTAHARISAGTSIELEAAHALISQLRDELGKHRAETDRVMRMWSAGLDRLARHAQSAHGLSGVDVPEFVGAILGESFKINNLGSGSKLSEEATERIQRARGERR